MSSKNGFISCAHIDQFKANKNGLKMYKLVYSSLIAICNQDSRKQKVLLRKSVINFNSFYRFNVLIFFKIFFIKIGSKYDVLYM